MQAKTLKERKAKKPVKTIKNLLCSPDLHWPLLDTAQGEKLLSIIRVFKPDTKLVKKMPWSQLKNIPKQERPKVNNICKHPFFSFGISECSRLLRKKICKLVMIDADVTPRILVSHIIDNATNALVPVVCVTQLKSVLQETFNFKSICISIKDDSTVHIPKAFNDFVTNFSKNKEATEKKKQIQEKNKLKEVFDDEIIISKEPNKTKNISVKDIVKDDSNLYLKRSDKSVRIFIPNSEPQMETLLENANFGDTFIKVSGNENIAKNLKKPRNTFKGMHLKRIQNNSSRKRKL